MPHCNNVGIRGAVRRITATRDPANVGLHDLLIVNQRGLKRTLGSVYVEWVAWFHREYKQICDTKGSATKERNAWCDAEHPKRKLRQAIRRQIYVYGKDTGLRMRRVRYKCKTGELLAVGKNPRGIGDLSCPGSSVAGYMFDWVKQVFSQKYVVGNYSQQFIKTPEKPVLKEVFETLMYPTGMHLYYFSDDACLSAVCSDGVFTANLDISQCDGSHYYTFSILKELIRIDPRYFADVDAVFEQCGKPFIVFSTDWKERIIFSPETEILYSGSSITTSLNNTALSLIGLNICRLVGGRMVSKGELRRIIVQAAEEMGFMLKVDVCHTYGDIQFLKHSPALVDGVVVPYKNIGAMLRGFGTIVGDLPGSTGVSLSKRAASFNEGVVRSWIHDGNTDVFQTFWRRYVGSDTPSFSTILSGTKIPMEEIRKRYSLRVSDCEELLNLISDSYLGDSVESRVLDVIYAKDYGY